MRPPPSGLGPQEAHRFEGPAFASSYLHGPTIRWALECQSSGGVPRDWEAHPVRLPVGDMGQRRLLQHVHQQLADRVLDAAQDPPPEGLQPPTAVEHGQLPQQQLQQTSAPAFMASGVYWRGTAGVRAGTSAALKCSTSPD